MSDQANIFVAFSGMQYLMSRLIIDFHGQQETRADNYLIFHSRRKLSSAPPANCRFIQVPEVGSVGAVLFKFGLKLMLTRIRYSSKHVAVHVGHPQGLIENYLVFRYPRDKAYLMQEGILNFYNYPINDQLRAQMRHFRKRGWLYALPYTPYEGHLSGVDQPSLYDGMYVLDDTGLYGAPRNVIRLDCRVPHADWTQTSTTILVLGQEIQSIVGAEHHLRCTQTLWRYVASTGCREVVFKPHQAQLRAEVQGVIDMARAEGLGVRLFDFNDPVELAISDIRPREVIGFFSSALANIRQIYPSVTCTSVGFDIFAKFLALAPVRSYFAAKGVQFVTVDDL